MINCFPFLFIASSAILIALMRKKEGKYCENHFLFLRKEMSFEIDFRGYFYEQLFTFGKTPYCFSITTFRVFGESEYFSEVMGQIALKLASRLKSLFLDEIAFTNAYNVWVWTKEIQGWEVYLIGEKMRNLSKSYRWSFWNVKREYTRSAM